MADRRIAKTRRSWGRFGGLLVTAALALATLPETASSQQPRNQQLRNQQAGNPRPTTLSEKDAEVAGLTAPMTAIVDGVAFRDAIGRLAQRAGVAVWLDRRVDPTAKVDLGSIGPTAFAAIERLAASRNCVAHLVGPIVIVGPADWVDRLSAELLLAKPTQIANVAWPELSTPNEALAAAMGESTELAGLVSASLPHDLWPAATWNPIDRMDACILIRGQFESLVPGDSRTVPVVRRYQASELGNVRQIVKQSDPSARVRSVEGAIEVRTVAAVHRLAAAAMLKSLAKESKTEQTFSVKTTTSAGSALVQFAGAANRQCVIEPSATAACETIITVEEKDVTLRELIDKVAQLAGVTTTWTETTVVISKTESSDDGLAD